MATGNAILGARTKVVINSSDFSADFNQVRLNFSQSSIDVTTFTVTGWAKYLTGISTASIDYTGFYQVSGHTLDSQLFSMLGAPTTATPWEIDVPDTNVGSVRYTGNGFLKTYPIDSKPVDAVKLNASIAVTGTVTRALISS